jgi:hypothetical protein
MVVVARIVMQWGQCEKVKKIAKKILSVLKAGHDVGDIGFVYVFRDGENNDEYAVEIFDPVNESYNVNKVSKYLKENFIRDGEVWYKRFDTPKKAVKCYLAAFAKIKR